jgi:hypothetical protein
VMLEMSFKTLLNHIAGNGERPDAIRDVYIGIETAKLKMLYILVDLACKDKEYRKYVYLRRR